MIREYTPTDKTTIMALLRLNTPAYFAPEEEHDFSAYLDNSREEYFVVETEGEIIGAGGINYTDGGKTACISWDVFHPKAQGKGWGTQLTTYRIGLIKQNPVIELIRVRTAQMTDKFYEKCGFELQEIIPDYWAKGFDLYRMEIKIK
jgi:[ribosomal protein S18]-alanine N-acetyltransferase